MSYVEVLEKEIEKEQIEMEGLHNEVLKIYKVLIKRSKALSNLLFLKMAYLNLIYTKPLNPKEFQAKRGRKSYIPIKEVMHILKIGHRQAQDYVRVLKALDLVNDWCEHQFRRNSQIISLRILKEGKG